MILNSAPANEAILSNVGNVNAFSIKATAKSFMVLSSQLYSNKIRAIIRELSCNAYDSHIAAGKKEVPFDVHLPNQLEPWFSVRDYGVGLNEQDVTTIFSTFFESTKTDSNDFVGALGLGSKSPFSYTDNFTVTATKNGIRGIYSAFINDQGVPSIAKMFEEPSTEPTGVEVKFSVNDRYDFDRFRQEARRVYMHFTLRPAISGSSYFEFQEQEYKDRDIVPGVHYLANSNSSIAVMGNIAYPIDVPQADNTLGDLRNLLRCGLEMHFQIGELDFQASREGLSYIPLTINSIKTKLEALNAQLAIHIAQEADKIPNLWERAYYLSDRAGTPLWSAAVGKYIADTKFPLTNSAGSYRHLREFTFKVEDLASKYNIVIRGFEKSKADTHTYNMTARSQYMGSKNGVNIYEEYWKFTPNRELCFVINQGKVGALERAKYHWKSNNLPTKDYRNTVLVLERADKTQEAKVDDFFKDIYNPPTSVIHAVDTLAVKPKAATGLVKNVSILKLERRDANGGYYRRGDDDMVWRDAGKLTSFDTKATHYYMPLSGFTAIDVKCSDVKQLHEDLQNCGIKEFMGIRVYGVRKSDLDTVKALANWVNVEDFISATLTTFTAQRLTKMALENVDGYPELRYNSVVFKGVTNVLSPYRIISEKFTNIMRNSVNKISLDRLCKLYGAGTVIDFSGERDKIVQECKIVSDRYPLIKYLSTGSDFKDQNAVIDYINMIDSVRGV